MTAVLQLIEVSRVHGNGATAVHALCGVSLEVAAGEFVAIMGPSGSGKSTLLNVGGLDTLSAGDVIVEDTALAGMSRAELAKVRRRSVGYDFQELNIIPALTAAENVSLPRELDGVSSPPRADRGTRDRGPLLLAAGELIGEPVRDSGDDVMRLLRPVPSTGGRREVTAVILAERVRVARRRKRAATRAALADRAVPQDSLALSSADDGRVAGRPRLRGRDLTPQRRGR
jgi:ABC-type sugar transport system ATPase subunit